MAERERKESGRESATPADTPDAFRIAAAALAGAPVGFAAGAVLGGQLLAAGASGEAGEIILVCALCGVLLASAMMALAATFLTPKPTHIVTLTVGAVSFAVVVYMVRDFIVDRMEQADALDAAYRSMPRFELSLSVDAPNRPPFSSLVYESLGGTYTALRPGGWRCEGQGSREQAVALYGALRQVRPSAANGGCERRVSWRIDDGAWEQGCADGNNHTPFSVADDMVERTERRSSCRRADDP